MVADLQSREQRLRKQAELQSLYLNLSSLREREASYIAVSAAVPELLTHQIDDLRRQINQVEDELLALGDESLDTPARRAYVDGLTAEQSGNFDAALKLYRQAARTSHPDADAAIRSVRYKIRAAKNRPVGTAPWIGGSASGRRFRLSAGLVGLVLLSLVAVTIAAVSSWRRSPAPPPVAAAT
ncbi:MAG: hypothetical protein D6784_04375, partial [Chloroflexi bacterium]